MPAIEYLEQVAPAAAIPPGAPASYFVDTAEAKAAKVAEVLRLQSAPLPGVARTIKYGRPVSEQLINGNASVLEGRVRQALQDLQYAVADGGKVKRSGSNRDGWTGTECADDLIVLLHELADRLAVVYPREVSE